MESIFKISKITVHEAINYNENFKSFLISKSGHLNLRIGSKEYQYATPFIVYLPENTEFSISEFSHDLELWKIDFTSVFFSDFFFEIQQFYSEFIYLNFENKPCFINIISICNMMDYEFNQSQINHNILYNLWISLFSIFRSEHSKKETIIHSGKNHYFQEFIGLLEENYKYNHSPEFYASKLVISPRQLNKIINDLLGKSILNLITARKMIEAKKEIINTNKHISEIGFELGYTEKSYFSKVFKNYYGITPSELKKQFN